MNESNRFDFDDIIDEILTPKKMSEYTDAKLPTIASEISTLELDLVYLLNLCRKKLMNY